MIFLAIYSCVYVYVHTVWGGGESERESTKKLPVKSRNKVQLAISFRTRGGPQHNIHKFYFYLNKFFKIF